MLLADFFEGVYRPLKLRNRSANTVRLYRYSIKCFSGTLGRGAVLDDLTDASVAQHLGTLNERGLSPYSVNKERSQLLAIWSFACRKKFLDRWPDVEPEVLPRTVPVAWQQPDLWHLLAACRQEPGELGNVPASLWWETLHLVAWDTAERIGALMQLLWSDVGASGWLIIRAATRKGRREDKSFRLGPDTMASLEAMRQPTRELIFPWPYSRTYLWVRYRRILQRAGLPTDRKSKFHRIRRSAASYYEAAGGNAQELLGHCNRETTTRYLDPRIVCPRQPSSVLFRLGGVSHGTDHSGSTSREE